MVRIRKAFLSLADSALKAPEDEVHALAKDIAANFDDAEIRDSIFDLALQLVVEQPLKIPFVAATVLVLNAMGKDIAGDVLKRVVERCNGCVGRGDWREVKLCLRFLGGLQGMLEGEGVWGVLQDFLGRAVDLQTGDSEEVGLLLLCGRVVGRGEGEIDADL